MGSHFDENLGVNIWKPECVDEALMMIWALGVGYDGCNTVESLKELIDELLEYNHLARVYLEEGKLFPEDT